MNHSLAKMLLLLGLLLSAQLSVATHAGEHLYQQHTEACEVFHSVEHSPLIAADIQASNFVVNVAERPSKLVNKAFRQSASHRYYSRAPPEIV